jgi:hypothetical protein
MIVHLKTLKASPIEIREGFPPKIETLNVKN